MTVLLSAPSFQDALFRSLRKESTLKTKEERTRLTYEERIIIEDMLGRRQSLYAIAKKLNRTVSTISREIRNRREQLPSYKNDCAYVRDCHRKNACGSTSCKQICRKCSKCKKYCPDYVQLECDTILNAPYVCNGCSKFAYCSMERYRYKAKEAQNRYRELLVERRSGFDVTLDELEYINRLVSPRLKNGQSPYHIKQTLQNELPVSESTLRRMIDSCELDARNLDLRNKVKRKQRNHRNLHSEAGITVSKLGHMYKDYLAYLAENDCSVVEMDCVEGTKEDNATLLTLHFTDFKMQLAFIMDNQTASNVVSVLDMLEETMGTDLFRIMFPCILGDNGKEFTDITSMERSINGGQRTKVFFCEPNRPDEKGHCENNHKYIRYVIPKGTSLEPYFQSDITLMMNHINSLKRKSLFGRSPYGAAQNILPEDFFLLLGLEQIPPEQLILNPKLLKKNA